ncbi:glutaredoxin 3 [Neorickettsia sennetsu]|uniref:Glutaredoxin n=1 Tax=Ehrlichia sennetsu (strain ATCC VR-367 / Miyayama) TaxID=222891 RepID=Q2GE95_EHRS3|nr:glutaredoxin 3 [Neorickettsia sennetsu]ABD46297.1 glutaredoxin 3 [Neorickettsia sennetsu str. Miyayama]
MNHKVVIYVKEFCPYCSRAKELLDRKGVLYTVVDITNDPDLAVVMMERSGGRKTVPQVFINDVCVGGFDDLNSLNESGKLNELLFLNNQ